MKAITIASLSVLALAGAACSETASKANGDTPETVAEVIPATAPADDGFNLRIPGEGPTAETSDDGFNLAIPDLDSVASDDGFNLPTELPSSSSLEAIPEIDTSILDEDTPEEPENLDEIIRID